MDRVQGDNKPDVTAVVVRGQELATDRSWSTIREVRDRKNREVDVIVV